MKVTGGTTFFSLRFFSRYLPPLPVYGAIYYFSSRPASSLPDIAPDFVSHFIEYAVLGFFFIRMVLFDTEVTGFTGPELRPVLFGFPVLVLLALLDEVHQYYVPTRHFEIKDIVVDSLGSLAGIALYLFIAHFLRTRSSRTKPTKISE